MQLPAAGVSAAATVDDLVVASVSDATGRQPAQGVTLRKAIRQRPDGRKNKVRTLFSERWRFGVIYLLRLPHGLNTDGLGRLNELAIERKHCLAMIGLSEM